MREARLVSPGAARNVLMIWEGLGREGRRSERGERGGEDKGRREGRVKWKEERVRGRKGGRVEGKGRREG